MRGGTVSLAGFSGLNPSMRGGEWSFKNRISLAHLTFVYIILDSLLQGIKMLRSEIERKFKVFLYKVWHRMMELITF